MSYNEYYKKNVSVNSVIQNEAGTAHLVAATGTGEDLKGDAYLGYQEDAINPASIQTYDLYPIKLEPNGN